MLTFYDNDVATITINTTSYSTINSFTTNTGSFTTIVRSTTTVYTDTLITFTIALNTWFEVGAVFVLGLPLDEFMSNGGTVSHSVSLVSGTLTNAVSTSTNSTHLKIALSDVTLASGNSGDTPTL